MLGSRPGGDALGHFLLEHQCQAGPDRRPAFGGQPFDQDGGADIVGQVGGDACPARQDAGFVQFQRIIGDDLQSSRIGSGDLFQRRQAPRVALHRDHLVRPFTQQRAGQSAGTGPDFIEGAAVRCARRAGDLGG